MSFLSLPDKDSKYQLRILHYSQDQKDIVKNDGSGVGNAMCLQSRNYKNIKGLYSFQNYVEIYAH